MGVEGDVRYGASPPFRPCIIRLSPVGPPFLKHDKGRPAGAPGEGAGYGALPPFRPRPKLWVFSRFVGRRAGGGGVRGFVLLGLAKPRSAVPCSGATRPVRVGKVCDVFLFGGRRRSMRYPSGALCVC